jgi:hypothetical protein
MIFATVDMAAINRHQATIAFGKHFHFFGIRFSVPDTGFWRSRVWMWTDGQTDTHTHTHTLTRLFPKVSGLSHNEITTINTRWEATQRVMAAKLTRLTHKIAIQLHLLAESCIICSSRSRRSVRKLLDTPSYTEIRLKSILEKHLWTVCKG